MRQRKPGGGRRVSATSLAIACSTALLSIALTAQISDEAVQLEHPSIAYSNAAVSNPVARLNERIASGSATLRLEGESGYLKSLLAALDVPIESQMALFSRASLQSRIISPQNPRTIFFNDSVSIAWVRGGFIEIAAHDADKGPVFYRLLPAGTPSFFRDNSCLGCHLSATTLGVPGLISRSVPAAFDGSIMPWLGNFLVDHRTPLADRWGGWYVTGQSGTSQHLGNAPLADRRLQELRPADRGPVLESLAGRVDGNGYLSMHSDVVALLVFEHQAHLMNLLARINADARLEATARVRAAAADIVDYMLFIGEAPLKGVTGTSGFAKVFSARGPRDSKGRSLRDLDLKSRLMRYPCSYMIYSEAFDGLPASAKTAIYGRLKVVLEGRDAAPRYAKLTAADRQAVLEILKDTKKDF